MEGYEHIVSFNAYVPNNSGLNGNSGSERFDWYQSLSGVSHVLVARKTGIWKNAFFFLSFFLDVFGGFLACL